MVFNFKREVKEYGFLRGTKAFFVTNRLSLIIACGVCGLWGGLFYWEPKWLSGLIDEMTLAEVESQKRNDRATYFYAIERQKVLAQEEENRINADSSLSVMGMEANQGSYRPAWSRFF